MILKKALEDFKRVSAVLIDAFFVADRDRNIKDFNPAFYALFPKSIARQLKKRRYDEVLHLELGTDRDLVDECSARGQAIRYDEIRGVIPEVRDMTLIVSAVPFAEENGAITAVLVLLRDVTDEAMIQNKYKQMLEIEADEKAKLESTIQVKIDDLLKTNELLNRTQKELMEYKKGLRVF